MAFNFLALSQSCREEIDPQIFMRIEALCGYLRDDYTVGKKKNRDQEIFDVISQSLQQKEILYTKGMYHDDKLRLREPYLYLKQGKKSHAVGARIVLILKKEGINSWDAILKLKNPTAENNFESSIESGNKTENQESGLTIREKVRRGFNQVAGDIESLFDENEKLHAENDKIRLEIQNLKNETDGREDYVKSLETQVALQASQIESAQSQLQKARLATLEQIAESNPLFYNALMEIAKKIKGEETERQRRRAEINTRLPHEFNWGNDHGTILYSDRFTKAVEDFKIQDQDRIIEAIKKFSLLGPKNHSFHTKKNEMRIIHSPESCFTSRATDEIRFSWKENGSVTIYFVYRKSNSALGQSES